MSAFRMTSSLRAQAMRYATRSRADACPLCCASCRPSLRASVEHHCPHQNLATTIEGIMKTLPSKGIIACLCAALAFAAAGVGPPASVFWGQWGRTSLHQGFVPVAGQTGSNILANIVYDPFTQKEQQGNYATGDL